MLFVTLEKNRQYFLKLRQRRRWGVSALRRQPGSLFFQRGLTPGPPARQMGLVCHSGVGRQLSPTAGRPRPASAVALRSVCVVERLSAAHRSANGRRGEEFERVSGRRAESGADWAVGVWSLVCFFICDQCRTKYIPIEWFSFSKSQMDWFDKCR